MVNLKPQLRGVPKQPLGASRAALAEYGTFTLEFMALSHRTGDPEFGQKAEAIILGVHKRDPTRVRTRCCQQPARLIHSHPGACCQAHVALKPAFASMQHATPSTQWMQSLY